MNNNRFSIKRVMETLCGIAIIVLFGWYLLPGDVWPKSVMFPKPIVTRSNYQKPYDDGYKRGVEAGIGLARNGATAIPREWVTMEFGKRHLSEFSYIGDDASNFVRGFQSGFVDGFQKIKP